MTTLSYWDTMCIKQYGHKMETMGLSSWELLGSTFPLLHSIIPLILLPFALHFLFDRTVERIQDSVDLVDNTVVGKDINLKSLGIVKEESPFHEYSIGIDTVEEDSLDANSDFNCATLESIYSDTVRQLARDKYAREHVVK
jgi:hypothetical protein